MARILTPLLGAIVFFVFGMSVASASVDKPPTEISWETKACVKCHKKNNPSLVQQWGSSKHYRAKVGCYECHKADASYVDAFIHDDKKVKNHISIIVSP